MDVKLATIACLALLSGCASMRPSEVARPSEVTLEEALGQLGTGLNRLAVAQGDLKTGMIASEATVTFNVTASAKDSTKLGIDLSVAPTKPYPKSGSLSADMETSSEGARGNTISIKFVNLASISKDADPAKLAALIDEFQRGGFRIFGADEKSPFKIPDPKTTD